MGRQNIFLDSALAVASLALGLEADGKLIIVPFFDKIPRSLKTLQLRGSSMVERLPVKEMVPGSSPGRGAKEFF